MRMSEQISQLGLAKEIFGRGQNELGGAQESFQCASLLEKHEAIKSEAQGLTQSIAERLAEIGGDLQRLLELCKDGDQNDRAMGARFRRGETEFRTARLTFDDGDTVIYRVDQEMTGVRDAAVTAFRKAGEASFIAGGLESASSVAAREFNMHAENVEIIKTKVADAQRSLETLAKSLPTIGRNPHQPHREVTAERYQQGVDAGNEAVAVAATIIEPIDRAIAQRQAI
jgi:hypothetical protein